MRVTSQDCDRVHSRNLNRIDCCWCCAPYRCQAIVTMQSAATMDFGGCHEVACIEVLELSMDYIPFDYFQRDFHSTADIEMRLAECCWASFVVVELDKVHNGKHDMEIVHPLPAFVEE